ncbi:MAG: sulfite exporter TauE/SafE family protein [Deltaproteobacteria bacterium]|nr:sulfite exporter TauE/SafE family protein [Deltaproteobacteria bacterium]
MPLPEQNKPPSAAPGATGFGAPADNPEPPPTHGPLATALITLGIGLGAGVLNGLFGIGGGILMVPGLIILRNMPLRSAVYTSLGTVFFLSLAALFAHTGINGFAFGAVETALLLLAGAAGAQVGALLLRRMKNRWVLFIFALMVLLSAINLAAGSQASGMAPSPGDTPWWAFAAVGLTAGFFSGLIGIGGGGIVLLALASLFQTPILDGLALAQLVNLVNSSSGLFAQRRQALVRWKDVLRLVPSALVGVALGVLVAVFLPLGALRLAFAVFFLLMGTRILVLALRSE